jgi:hypothetical protein
MTVGSATIFETSGRLAISSTMLWSAITLIALTIQKALCSMLRDDSHCRSGACVRAAVDVSPPCTIRPRAAQSFTARAAVKLGCSFMNTQTGCEPLT